MSTLYQKFTPTTSAELEDIAAKIAEKITAPAVIFLEGQLGAGKTTFAKGFLRGCGYVGLVKSPTFTIVEHYVLDHVTILHADLYRIDDPRELELIGFRDYFNAHTIALIEWASKAPDFLPKPTMQCQLTIAEQNKGRLLEII